MTPQDAVIRRIFLLCMKQNWTLKQLSQRCGIPLNELERLTKQEDSVFTITQIAAICNAFSISLSVFFDTADFRRQFPNAECVPLQ